MKGFRETGQFVATSEVGSAGDFMDKPSHGYTTAHATASVMGRAVGTRMLDSEVGQVRKGYVAAFVS